MRLPPAAFPRRRASPRADAAASPPPRPGRRAAAAHGARVAASRFALLGGWDACATRAAAAALLSPRLGLPPPPPRLLDAAAAAATLCAAPVELADAALDAALRLARLPPPRPYAAWRDCAWAPLLEEAVYRGVLQRRLGRAASSAAFALAHLPSDAAAEWARALPPAAAAGACSYFCFGRLFEERGLAAAVGAHAAHNALVYALMLVRMCEGRRLAGGLVLPTLGPMLPAAVYLLSLYRWARGRARRRARRSTAAEA
ncbi:hypothetical protein AB1Y20_015582 [Prymnesium parvum]|uniref:CAAX prenyl protease 2/Lysostaphin resistance protein A-like domain-containing protein n=1 Tax=Prymnesium parvum TaxID=97485 RepID=A0AB34K1Y1_PRYPA